MTYPHRPNGFRPCPTPRQPSTCATCDATLEPTPSRCSCTAAICFPCYHQADGLRQPGQPLPCDHLDPDAPPVYQPPPTPDPLPYQPKQPDYPPAARLPSTLRAARAPYALPPTRHPNHQLPPRRPRIS